MRKLLLLRPEPGLSASAERARGLGLEVLCSSLFQVEPVGWDLPDPAKFDGLLITSANALRHGGAQLESLRPLPVHAVGPATAEAAKAAGFDVVTIGKTNVTDLLDGLPQSLRLLHLAGEDHRDSADPRLDRQIVYRSAEIDHPDLPALDGLVVAVHSPRAGRRLAELVSERSKTAIAAISPAAADACGQGWERIEAAQEPSDNCLLALAAMLCHTSRPE